MRGGGRSWTRSVGGGAGDARERETRRGIGDARRAKAGRRLTRDVFEFLRARCSAFQQGDRFGPATARVNTRAVKTAAHCSAADATRKAAAAAAAAVAASRWSPSRRRSRAMCNRTLV